MKENIWGKGKVLLVGGESIRIVRIFVVCTGFLSQHRRGGWTSRGNSVGFENTFQQGVFNMITVLQP